MNKIRKEDIMELIDLSKLTTLLDKVRGTETEVVVTQKKSIDWKKVLAVVALIAAVCAGIYAIYRYLNKDYEDEFLDDFDDDDYDNDEADDDEEEDDDLFEEDVNSKDSEEE
jgi:hypothetical protein